MRKFIKEMGQQHYLHKVCVYDKTASERDIYIFGLLPNVVVASNKLSDAEDYVISVMDSTRYKVRKNFIRGMYTPVIIDAEIGIYKNNDQFDTDITPEQLGKPLASLDIIANERKKEIEKEENLENITGEKNKKKYSVIQITDSKRQKTLYTAAIKAGEKMYGKLHNKTSDEGKGTHGGYFRFADRIEDVNFYEIKKKNFNRISDEPVSVNSFVFFPISNKPGTEKWYDDNDKFIVDTDGNKYVADDYDSVYDSPYRSSIWVITP